MHLATTAASETFHGEDQLKKLETLYFGTKNVLDFAVASGAKKVLFTSSGVAYGPIDQFPEGVPESYLGGPDLSRADSALGEGKRVAEYLCAYYGEKYGLNCAIARCFAFVGPLLPLDLHYAIGNFIKDALAGSAIVVNGDGQPVRSYLYMSDAITWLISMMLKADTGAVFNVGSSSPISIRDLANTVSRALSQENQIVVMSDAMQNTGNFNRSSYIPQRRKITEELQVQERISLLEGIRKTVKFLDP
jgi:dTDP-glucose 4,6-dehydratase/UDP-glucose 4-epimerase